MSVPSVRIENGCDRILFDTVVIEPGQCLRMFGNARVGQRTLCNLDLAGQPHRGGHEEDYLLYAIGARVLGSCVEDEIVALDHIVLGLNFRQPINRAVGVGGDAIVDLTGPVLSLRANPRRPCGYVLMRPQRIPYRQTFAVDVEMSQIAPSVTLRVFLFGERRASAAPSMRP